MSYAMQFHRSVISMLLSAASVLSLLFLVGCGGGNGSSAPKINTSRASSLIKNYAVQTNRSSVSGAIVRGNSLLWSQGTGKANKELNTVTSDDTVYAIASVSKVVTAMAVMQLVEAGKLNLDADINAYLPYKVTNPQIPTAVITLRHLLTHTSGMVDDYYNTVSYPALYYRDVDPPLSLADFCKAIFAVGGQYYSPQTFSANAPGTAYNYCNIAYALAGYIVEAAAGESFADYTKRHIFTPLGMTKSSWRVKDFTAAQMAMPYDLDGTPLGNYTFADYPDGGLRTTVKDMSRFLRASMLGGTLDGQTILKPASVAEMKQHPFATVAGAEKQGLGWEANAAGNYAELIGKVGGERGISTVMAYNPATNTGAIVFTNRGFDSDEDGNALQSLIVSLIATGENK